jgi:hypothetical protein
MHCHRGKAIIITYCRLPNMQSALWPVWHKVIFSGHLTSGTFLVKNILNTTRGVDVLYSFWPKHVWFQEFSCSCKVLLISGETRNIFCRGRFSPWFFSGWRVGSTNSVEDRRQREQEYGDVSSLVRGSTQYVKKWNPYSDYVVTHIYSTELGIRLRFVKIS